MAPPPFIARVQFGKGQLWLELLRNDTLLAEDISRDIKTEQASAYGAKPQPRDPAIMN